MRTYHLALIKGTNPNTLTLQARRCLDDLSCKAWQYLGERIVTKAHLKDYKQDILDQVNGENGTHFTRLVID